MKRIFAVIAIIMMGCSFKKNLNPEEITCVEAINIFPNIDKSGVLSGYDTSFTRVYSLGKVRVYEFSYKNLSKEKKDMLSAEQRTSMFVFHVDSLYGYRYDSSQGINRQREEVNLEFQTKWIRLKNIFPAITSNIGVIISKKEDNNTNFVTYKILNKEDSSELGTMDLYFAKHFIPTEVTLSKQFDSMYIMKLVKYQTKAFHRYYKEQNTTMPEFTIVTTLTEIKEFNRKAIAKYFKDYQPDKQLK